LNSALCTPLFGMLIDQVGHRAQFVITLMIILQEYPSICICLNRELFDLVY